ncbi:MAG: tetratricopeptide repeat protein [Candidatus Latescibacterota bacterium]|nr:tetratricopeptide repeat protein [Candidatus Latescibacterota bacterium]
MDRIVANRGWALALILGCGLLAFHNVLGHGFHYDDDHSIRENPHLRSLANVPRFFVDPGAFSGMPEARMYRPLLLATYAVNYAIAGYAPLGWHLVNLLLHLANAALLWWLAPGLGASRRVALVAGLIFAVHPVVSESVNYVSSRSSLLATFFLLLACKGLGSALGGRAQRDWPLVAATYCGALLAKSIAIVFPLLAGMYMGLVGRWRRGWLGALVAIAMLYVLGTRAIIGKALLEPVRGPVAQWATQLKAGAFYIWKVALPVGLSVEPQFAVSSSFFSAPVLLAALMLVSLVGLCFMARQRALVVLGAGWFAIGLLPSSLVPLHILVNEHRLYLPMVGWALGLAALLDRGRLGSGGWVGLVVLMGLSVQRNEIWRDEEALWRDAVAKGPLMGRPHVNLGKALLEKGQLAAAIAASHRALEIDPGLERAHYNIGTAYMREERLELAVAHFRRALEIRPEMLPALNNLGNSYQEQGLWQQALATYRRALAVQEHASIYHNIGHTFLAAGRADSARSFFRRALDADPALREAYKGLVKACRAEDLLQSAVEVLTEALSRWPQDRLFLLLRGDVLAAMGREEEAIASYRRADKDEVEIWQRLGAEALKRRNWEDAKGHFDRALGHADNAIAHNGRGTALLELGGVRDALESFRQAARLDPESATAFANIGRAYLRYGRAVEAIAALERASALEPETGRLQALLAQAMEQVGKLDEAMAAYKKAIALAPENGEYYHNLGYLYYGKGEVLEAENMYRKALMRNPRQLQVHFNLGGLYFDQEHYQRASAAYKAALAIDPEYADAWINLASTHLQLGQNEWAIKAYQHALGLELAAAIRVRVERQLEALQASTDP